ncbi:MAG: ATP-binding cassette domain-containing protein, partial [candidate division NC10 bacterium]
MTPPFLSAEGLDVAYGDFQVLWSAGIRVQEGEVVCLLGPNGAGKSTLMNTLSGLLKPRGGRVEFRGKRIDGLPPHQIVGEGLGHVLERRRLFPYLTVRQNLLLGAHHPEARRQRAESLRWVEGIFPFLIERQKQLAHTLSGGQQQMVAIARGLMA